MLKSLIGYDDLGAVNTITLPGKESLDQIFRDLPFNAAALASPVDLLNTLQGAEVEIKGGSALQGRLLKVTADTVLLPDKLGSTTRHRITVMTPQGLRQAVLEDIEALRFTDPVLQEQMQKALTAVSEHRAQNSRTLRVQVKSAGKRTVRAGYVVEAPLWKTSYRLNLDASLQPNTPVQSRLQGWALLENMSGQDWEGVELTLRDANMTIAQDGKLLAQTEVAGALGEQLRGLRRLKPVTWRSGVYGPFAGKQLDGSVTASAKP